jgi:hypothetical protein
MPSEDIDRLPFAGEANLTSAERNAARVLRLVPDRRIDRTRDVVQVDVGDERGIVVVVTAEAIELRLPTIEWCGPHDPRRSSRLWKRLDPDELDDAELLAKLSEARAAREAEFRVCRYCGGSFPPEHRIRADVCHGCASEHEGVAF